MLPQPKIKAVVTFFVILLVAGSSLVFLPAFGGRVIAADSQGVILLNYLSKANMSATPVDTLATVNPDGTGLARIGAGYISNYGGAQLSPDGTKVVFAGTSGNSCDDDFFDRSDIYVMNVDGTGITDLTAGLPCYIYGGPTWSPDGSKILFGGMVNTGSGHGIYQMNADGSNVQLLTDHGNTPDYSPDGRRFVYVDITGGTGLGSISIANVDGSNSIAIVPDVQNAQTYDITRYIDPIWSPDGTKIAFTDQDNLYTVNPDGTDMTEVYQRQVQLACGQPVDGMTWSPDSTRIVFAGCLDSSGTNGSGNPNELVSVPVTGGSPTILYEAPDGVIITQPFWGYETVNQAPALDSLSAGTVIEGSSYNATGAFQDPDSSSWTATVDYGDGSGVQPLALTGSTFSLSHQYQDEGSYTVAVAVTDNQGATGAASATVTVTNAPFVVSAISAPTAPMAVNSAISATATVTDPGVLDTHTAMWNWGDGSTSRGTVSETGGSGSVQAIHTYTAAGVYTVALTFTDDDGLAVAALPFQYIVVYDPSAGFATGSGWFTSPAGAYSANPSLTGKLHFGFNARYQTGTSVPSGSGRLIFPAANLTFQLSSYQWLVVSGASVQLEGTGTINGAGDYTLLISAVAGSQPGGGGTDLIRLMLWDSATGQIIYDSQPGAPETAAPTTPLGAGKLSVH